MEDGQAREEKRAGGGRYGDESKVELTVPGGWRSDDEIR